MSAPTWLRTCAAIVRPALSAAATFCALPALAQSGDSPTQLEPVFITASRSSTRLQDMPLHTTVVTQEEIRRSPAATLDQVLRNIPGLLVSGAPAFTTDPTGHNIKFRGMDKKVLVLLDGVPVLDPFYTTIQWFKVPLSSIERVEIVRGGGSSLWGNLAVGGVINIVSKRPSDNSGEATWSVGALDTWTASLSKNFMLSDSIGLSLAADGFESAGYDNTPAALRAAYWPGRGRSAANSTNFRAGLHYQSSREFSAYLRGGYHLQNETIGGYAYGDNLQKSPDIQAGFTRQLGDASRLVGNVYAQRVSFDKFNGAGCYAASTFACGASVAGAGASAAQQAAPTLQYASSHDINTYRERGASVVYSHRMATMLEEMQFGLDLRRISGEDAQQSYRTPTAALPAALRVQRENQGAGAQAFTGVFSQFKLRPWEPTEITLSARVDRFKSSDGLAVQTTYSNVAVPVAATPTGGSVPDLSKTAFDPSISFRHELSDAFDLRGSVYKAFRAPGLNNMYRSFGSASISIANPLLGPETLLGKEIGLDWTRGANSLGITAFEADVKDVVATYAITPTSPIPDGVKNICGATYTGVANAACPGTVNFYTNGQDQKARGIELTGNWAPSRHLTMGGYLTGTQTFYTRTTTGDPIDRQLPLIPRLVAGANLAWRSSERWTQFVEVRYNGGMTLSSLTLNPAIRQGGYTVVNASSSCRVDEHLEVSFGAVNLTDKRYTDGSASTPQGISLAPPRGLRLSMRVGF